MSGERNRSAGANRVGNDIHSPPAPSPPAREGPPLATTIAADAPGYRAGGEGEWSVSGNDKDLLAERKIECQ